MPDTTSEELDEVLDAIDSRLVALGQALSSPVSDDLYHRALVALGHQARSIFEGVAFLATSENKPAALVLMRTAVEINLTLRFLVLLPALHPDIWAAEGDRQTLILVREIAADRELAEKHGHIDLPDSSVAEREQYIDEVRTRAIAAGVIGVRERGSLMPDLRTLAVNYGDLATREAYTLADRPFSGSTHGTAGAFGQGCFVREQDGRLTFTENLGDLLGTRALNASTFASTLCVLAEPLELDVFNEADQLRGILLEIRHLDDQ